LKATAGKSITSESEFKEWLKVIRGQGFVIEAETALEGIAGVAAPVRDFTGGVIAAIGVGFISSSANAKGIQQMVKEVTDTAAAISRELGFIDKNEA
jgi:DNA-binding IclR family transcriptional regulator